MCTADNISWTKQTLFPYNTVPYKYGISNSEFQGNLEKNPLRTYEASLKYLKLLMKSIRRNYNAAINT